MRRLFGTDGIRGRANRYPMTAEVALRLGMATGKLFMSQDDRRHLVIIGKDTRLSGYMIEPALVAGFASVGMDVRLLGPMPTPGVAMMTRSMRADLGVMISASHNGYADNGIKLFGPDGYKLSDQRELEIEALMNEGLDERLAGPGDLGRVARIDDSQARYVEIAKSTFPRGVSLKGLRVVIDCANGAAYKVAPTALYELGADVIPIGVGPNGFNTNEECGSTHPEVLARAVKQYRADMGIALDGDADRLVISDEKGQIVDGDQIMAMIAHHWARSERLTGGGVVGTVMSNLGLERFLVAQNLKLERTQVGDRSVMSRMREGGFNLGGEQSGHPILSDFSTTGDGLLAALQVLAVRKEAEAPMSTLARQFDPVPQAIQNVRVGDGNPLEDARVRDAITAAEARLNGSGRIVVRASGTEPFIRIMSEGDDAKLISKIVRQIAGTVEKASSDNSSSPRTAAITEAA